VRSFVVMGEIDREGDGGHGVLSRVRLVSHRHWKAQAFDPNPVDRNIPVVFLVLDVGELLHVPGKGKVCPCL